MHTDFMHKPSLWVSSKIQKLKNESLMARTLRALAASFSLQLTQNILRLASNLILARLLAPEAFGLFSVALTVQQAAVMFADFGISRSIVANPKGATHEFLNTAFLINLMLHLIMICIVLAVSIFIFFNTGLFPEDSVIASPVVPFLISCTGLNLLFYGLSSPRIWVLTKNLEISKVLLLELTVQVFAIIITVSAAFSGLGVWSFVLGVLLSRAAYAMLSYVALERIPLRLHIDKSMASEILHFGKWLIPASMAGYILSQSDKLFLSVWMPAPEYSLYVVGSLWALAASTLLERGLQSIAFPSLAEALKKTQEEANKFYRQFRLLVDVIYVLAFLGFNLVITLLIEYLYPEAYAGSLWYARILSLGILLAPYYSLTSIILSAGDSKNFSGLLISKAIILVPLALMAHHFFGPQAAIYVFALRAAIALPVTVRIASKSIEINTFREYRMLVISMIAATCMVLMTP